MLPGQVVMTAEAGCKGFIDITASAAAHVPRRFSSKFRQIACIVVSPDPVLLQDGANRFVGQSEPHGLTRYADRHNWRGALLRLMGCEGGRSSWPTACARWPVLQTACPPSWKAWRLLLLGMVDCRCVPCCCRLLPRTRGAERPGHASALVSARMLL
jgi:hypothetical protein